MRILIDTNVFLDFLQRREPYLQDAISIMELAHKNIVEGVIAAHSISNMFYILRKDYSIEKRKQLIRAISDVFPIIPINKEIIQKALDDDMDDFEDAIQYECAVFAKVDYIVTRNVSDYINTSIRAITPKDFLQIEK